MIESKKLVELFVKYERPIFKGDCDSFGYQPS